MKNLLLFLSILLSLFVMTNSCISEKISDGEGPIVDPPETPPDGDKYVFRFNATVESGSVSKQSMATETVGLFLYKNRSVDFIENNKLIVLNNSYYEYEYETGGSDSSGYCFAYYPYSSTAVEGTVYSGELPQIQNQAVSISLLQADIPPALLSRMLMISDHSDVVSFKDEIASVQFKNVFSIFRFAITKDPDLVRFAGQKIKKFDMYMAGRDTLTPLSDLYKLAGTYTIDLKYIPGTTTYSEPVFSSEYKSEITAEIENSPEITSNISTPVVIWIVVPPFKFYSNKLVVRMETESDNGETYKTFSTFSGFGEIPRNEVIPFDVKLTADNLYSDDVPKESFVDRPANTYIISEPGLYEIPARKISGELPVSTGDFTADWLWASKAGGGQLSDEERETLISNVSFGAFEPSDPDRKTIRFRVGTEFDFMKGNVVLALKDAEGNIMWTWHIWITDKPENIRYGAAMFMDRNIGALSADTASSPAVDTYGLVYQWGRKDPFFGGDGRLFDEGESVLSVARAHTRVNKDNPAITWGADAENVTKWSPASMSDASIEKSIKYPMRFFYNENASSEHDPADWLSPNNLDLWSDEEKTDYDPCPHGYKVPAMGDFSALYSAYNEWSQPPSTEIWFYNEGNSNRYWVYSYQHTPTAWPVAGMRRGWHRLGKSYGSQLIYSGTDGNMGHGYYWTSTPWREKEDGPVIPGLSYSFQMRDVVLYSKDTGGANADAYSVRCVKE
ncbi:MAG: hypothetical protein LBL79_13905 [Prevotella sp.]|jgi:hypothetical protein|nr:hypothetical protein [Prevotella sp.]